MPSEDSTPPQSDVPDLPTLDQMPAEEGLTIQDTFVDLPAFELDDDKTDPGLDADTDGGDELPDETIAGDMTPDGDETLAGE